MSKKRSEDAAVEERVVPMRLQRFLARAGVASRRGSESLMTAGRVYVNGVCVRELGSKVDPRVDVVEVDGVEVRLSQKPAYLVLYKPAGYLTTMSDPHGRHCVASLVPTDRYPGLFPVGRLDLDTTGILLFTTNGDVAQRLLHPSSHVSKHYVTFVQGKVGAAEIRRLARGVMLDDGPAQPAAAEVLDASHPSFGVVAPHGLPKDKSVVGITLHEGRKHQVKRMMEAVGHKVLRLHRDEFGPLELNGCAQGSWRLLTPEETAMIEAI